MAHSGREVEIKLPVKSAATARRLLRAAGFEVIKRRVFESNVIFDTPALDLRRRGALIRLREAGGGAVVTYKGPPKITRHKSREELETGIGDARVVAKILRRLGYVPGFRYEKYRTEFQRHGDSGVAMLDETPAGVFLELEGPARWIDATARELGFAKRDYITASYVRLHLERGGSPDSMRFHRSPASKS
ncbi:MAG TPA: class IV adenylate cyclase [Bryobacteraceae bacterium]|jgi:adenylate cyclase class 2